MRMPFETKDEGRLKYYNHRFTKDDIVLAKAFSFKNVFSDKL